MNTRVHSRRQARVAARRNRWGSIVPLVAIGLGVIVMAFPVVSTQVNNAQQRQVASNYSGQVAAVEPASLQAELQRARDYNATLTGVPILDPWLSKVSQSDKSDAYRQYESLLGDVEVMARVRVPAVAIDLPVRHGTGDEALATGAGHLYGTSLPVGGSGTHSVITSHTAFGTATLFDRLSEVKRGDRFFIDVYGETLAYEVDEITVVLPSDISALEVVPGEDYVTLFTCTPYAVNTHRLMVRGHRVPFDKSMQMAETASPLNAHLPTWMWVLLAGAGAGVIVIIVIARKEFHGSGTREQKRSTGTPSPQ